MRASIRAGGRGSGAHALTYPRVTAKQFGNYFVEPEPKLLFVTRIRGINKMPPQPKKILDLLRLRQAHFFNFSHSGLRIYWCSDGMVPLHGCTAAWLNVTLTAFGIIFIDSLESMSADPQRRVPQGQQGYHQHAPYRPVLDHIRRWHLWFWGEFRGLFCRRPAPAFSCRWFVGVEVITCL